MKIHEALFEVLEELKQAGWEDVEIFYKKGRSRAFRTDTLYETTSFRQEEGWAVRAGDARRSFYFASAGTPRPDAPWPPANGAGLHLPEARPIPHWTPPSTLDSPILSESEARGFFETIARELDREVPGARLLVGHLEDGSSESQILSNREVATAVRHRAASLRLVALGPGFVPARDTESSRRGPVARPSAELELAEHEGRRFSPSALARRLADHLLISAKGDTPARDRGEFLLAPPVMAKLLAALSDLWLGPEAERRAAALLDRRGLLGSSALTIFDDGRLAGGIFETPTDGEGQPTRRVTLVEEGGYRQPLLSWQQAGRNSRRSSGCMARPGWRDLPRQSFSHLYLESDSATSVGSLVGSLSRGYYLLRLDGEPRRDGDRFAARVAGFAIEAGRPTGPVTGIWLTGTVPALLSGVIAVARDLSFIPAGRGLVGAPSVLVRGLELRREP